MIPVLRTGVLLLFILMSGCSLKPAEKPANLRIDLNALSREAGLRSLNFATLTTPPSTVAGFLCFGVNVIGPGIGDSSLLPQYGPMIRFNNLMNGSSYCSYRGIATPPMGISTGQVNLAVPQGSVRLVQIVGINDASICQSGVLDNPSPVDGAGKIYEIGRGVVNDLFGDRLVQITLNWNGAANQASRVMDCAPPQPAPEPTASYTLTKLSAGDNVSCAEIDGITKCTGTNGSGQLGNGTITSSNLYTPVTNTLMTSVSAFAMGSGHTCARTPSGAVYCWGNNQHGQLGDSSTTDSSVPVLAIASGATSLSVGSNHSCAIVSGFVNCWGRNYYGQFGTGNTNNSSAPVVATAFGTGVTQVSAGTDFTCALTASGTVKCSGINDQGQLGNGSNTDSPSPTSVSSLTGVSSLPVKSFAYHMCAKLTSGGMKCWGANAAGELGDGNQPISSNVPVDPLLPAGSTLAKLSLGGGTTCATLSSGALYCWGNSSSGEVGIPGSDSYPVPQQVFSSGVSDVSSGGGHTCALLSTGFLNCWGSNTYGQYGNGTTTSSTTPTQISL